MGERVTVYDEHEGWAWGQLEADGYVGYLPSEALGDPEPTPTHRVAALRTFVYPGPNLKLPPPVPSQPRRRRRRHRARRRVAPASATGGFVFAAASRAARRPRAGLRRRRRALPRHALSVGRQDQPRPRLLGPRPARARGRRHRGAARHRHAGGGARPSRRARAGSHRPARGDLVFWKGHVGVMLDAVTPPPRQRPPHGGRDRAARRGRGAHPAEELRADRRGEAAELPDGV